MKCRYTLEFLQASIGAEYVELNPHTGEPRLVSGLNEVWDALDEHGGIAAIASRFGLAESVVWSWVDDHYMPLAYAQRLADTPQRLAAIQMPSAGYEDLETGACWPWTWRMH